MQLEYEVLILVGIILGFLALLFGVTIYRKLNELEKRVIRLEAKVEEY
ncbi:MAG: hypothetical protein ACTSQI_07730 [Candidatus Helarchaeota archaeon]